MKFTLWPHQATEWMGSARENISLMKGITCSDLYPKGSPNKKKKNTFTCFNENLLDKVQHFHNLKLSFNSNQPLKLPLQLQSAAFDHLEKLMKKPDNKEVKLIYFKYNTRINHEHNLRIGR